MRLILHPKVYTDIDKITEYYEQVASPELADAAEKPASFSIRESDIRRVNLRRFPYHFLFRIVGDVVRILVVRHHGRRPAFGMRRQ